MNDKAQTNATRPVVDARLWKVPYSYVGNHFELRTRTLVITALNTSEAEEKAKVALTTQGLNAFRIGKIVEY